MALLKTVFEVNLALFGKREGEKYVSFSFSYYQAATFKGNLARSTIWTDHFSCSTAQRTLLLFVIRDHIGATPLANLQATLTADILRIWEGLTKPQGLQGVRMEEFFDMEFVGLPHKVCPPLSF